MVANLVSSLVQARVTQRNISNIQAQSNARSVELSTGKKADIVGDLGGSVRNYLDITSVRKNLEGRKDRIINGDNRLSQIEIGLEQINIQTETFKNLSAQIGILDKNNLRNYTREAATSLESVSNALNLQWGGRYLFGGDKPEERPLQNTDALITTVKDIINAHATASPDGKISDQAELDAALAEIDTVFNDTHTDLTKRFSALVYNGGTGEMPGIETATGEIMQYGVKADATAIRNITKSLALLASSDVLESAVLPSETALPSDLHTSFLKTAAFGIKNANHEVIELRGEVGFKQQRLSQSQEALDSIIFRYDQQIGAYENADPYEASVKFQELQQQLQASFYVTAKLSEQSLMDYLR